jgi:thiamine biosynthesis lipoprotein
MRYFFCMLMAVALVACKGKQEAVAEVQYVTVEGQAQGTYYRVTYADPRQRDFKAEFEAFFEALNREVSTYLDTSLITVFNKDKGKQFSLPSGARHFMANLEKSREVYLASDGAFDPTVMPLVAYWGFGPKPGKVLVVDSTKVDALRACVGLNKLSWTRQPNGEVLLEKGHPGIQLDFNAIAQGYAVDEIGRMLEAQGLTDYLIDIGGEVLAKGENPRGQVWTIGINAPREDGKSDEILAALPLDNRALATSGNYRKFYAVNGVKFSHTINPVTGFPERNALLSASVFAPDAMTADAYATACMVLGPEKALQMIEKNPSLDAYFVTGTADGKMQVRYSKGLKLILDKQ